MKKLPFAVFAAISLSGCSVSTWRSEPFPGGTGTTPSQVVANLGQPALVDSDAYVPHRRVTEYRYYIVDRSGQVAAAQYFFDGGVWASETVSIVTDNGEYRILNPKDRGDADQISAFLESRSWLKRKKETEHVVGGNGG